MREIKNVFANVLFWTGLAVLTAAFYLSGREYMGQLAVLFDGQEGEGPAIWIEVFQYCITAKNGMMFVPICAPLAAGACAEMELRSRYALFSCCRIGKRSYCRKKIWECVLPGGLMVFCSELLVLLLAFVRFYRLSPPPDGSEIGGIIGVILFSLGEGFLNGMLWAGAGGTAAVLARNPYIAYALPFVTFYVLTVFQERYYRSLFFLSPKCWADPVYFREAASKAALLIFGGCSENFDFGHVFCIGILSGMCAVCFRCFPGAVKRRLDLM